MKKTTLILMVVLLSKVGYSCDVCGCGALSNGFGYSPYLNSHFVGLTYSRQWYQFEHPLIPGEEPQNGKDVFNNLELQSRVNLSKRLRLYLAIPLKHIKRIEDREILLKRGLGDLRLFGSFDVLQYRSSEKKSSAIFQVGGGLKLPTGSYYFDQEIYQSPILQLGTGSLDFLIFSNFSYVRKSLGFNWQNQSSINTANKDGYKFGNRFDQQIKAYLIKQSGLVSAIPNIGLRYVAQNKDLSNQKMNIVNDYSGMQLLMAGFGLDVYRNMLGISAEFNVLVKSELSRGYVKPKPNFNIQFNYYFNIKKEKQ